MGFETMISGGERPKIYALDRTATGTGTKILYISIFLAVIQSTLLRGHNK
jgi:hypothetical protein